VTKVREVTFSQFAAGLKRLRKLEGDEQALPDKEAKALAGWLSPCKFLDDYRASANALESHAIGFDFDMGTAAADIQAALAGLNYVLVSTFSHYADGSTPRYRLFIPYADPILHDVERAHARVWSYFKGLLPSIDISCADVGRLWYMPAAPADRQHLFEHYAVTDAASYDWRAAPEPVHERKQVPADDGNTDQFQPGTFHRDFLRLAGRLRRGGVDYDTAELSIIAKCEQVGADTEHHLRTLRDVYAHYEQGEAFPDQEPEQRSVIFTCDPLPADIATRDWPEHPCAIDGLLPMGCVTLFASQDGLGKSRGALLMAACVAAGRPFLGDFDAGQGEPVYYLNKEDPLTEMYRRLKWILADFTPEQRALVMRNLRIASPNGQVELVTQASGVVHTSQVDELIEAIGKARLVIADTLSRVHALEENNNAVGAKLIGAGERIARETGAAFMFVHHSGKAAAREGVEGAGASRGAHALEGNSRSVLRLMLPGKDDEGMYKLPKGALKLVQAKFSYGRKMHPRWLRTNDRGVLLPFVPEQRPDEAASL
jgi:hypothetical protein